MTRIHIRISTDRLTAELQLRRGAAQERNQLAQALATAGVCHGVDADAVDKFAGLLANPDASGKVCIARGTTPVAGVDGKLAGPLLEPPKPGTMSGAGTINYRERGVLRPIKNGEQVASIVKPTKSQPGRDVTGKDLTSDDGKPFTQKLGPGVRRADDALFATAEGVVLATDSRIDVVPLYTHKGNVDYSSGNLHSAGSLEITGNIDSGFEATADGDIAINGAVDGGCESGGSIDVRQGVLDMSQAVRANQDIRCKHATSARLVASKAIYIGDQALQSILHAPTVLANEGRGSVRGGEVLARECIEVCSAGAPAGTPTLLAVGQLLEERGELARRTAHASREGRLAARAGSSGRAGKGVRNALRANDRAVEEQLRLRRRQREILRDATIRVTQTCHQGTTIQFGLMRLVVESELHGVLFRYDLESNTIRQEILTRAK